MWRAVQSRVRSSGVLAHSKPSPPCSPAMSCTVSACSFTPASVPWNSISSSGDSRMLRPLWALTARTALASSSSQRAIGTPIWMTWMVVATAACTLGKWQMAALTASGSG